MMGGMGPFRATSKRTRIETENPQIMGIAFVILSEQHPREQGLKQIYLWFSPSYRKTFRATSKRTRIETTSILYNIRSPDPTTFRATSKRTRIETVPLALAPAATAAFRATSKRTRIET